MFLVVGNLESGMEREIDLTLKALADLNTFGKGLLNE